MNLSASTDSLVTVARTLHADPVGWVYAVGDRADIRHPLWLDLSKPNWTQLLRRYALDQGGAGLSISSYRQSGSKAKTGVLRARWVMLDADGSRLWRFASPGPAIAVASRTAGHAHVLWRLRDNIDPKGIADLCRGQRDLLDGDRGFSAGATATMRLPLEAEDVLRLDPERTCSALDLRRHHRVPKLPPKQNRDSVPADSAATAVVAVRRRLAEVEQGESRNVTGWRLAGDLWSRGLSQDEATDAGLAYVETVEDLKLGDDPYELEEWESQVGRRYKDGGCIVDPEFIGRVNDWETGWLDDPSTSSSQKTIISALAGRWRSQGTEMVTASRRMLELDARLSLPAVQRALRGSKTRDGLLGRALKRDARRRNGAKNAHRFELINSPSALPTAHTAIGLSTVACERMDPPSKSASPSATVPQNHGAWSWSAIGHGPRLVFDVLVSFDQPTSPGELTKYASLSDHKSTLRKQLRKLEAAGLARRGPDGRWVAVTEDLEALLDVAAEVTERPNADGTMENWSQRHHRRSEAERLAYAERITLYTDPERIASYCQQRDRRARQRIGKRSQARRRRERLERFNPLPAKASR